MMVWLGALDSPCVSPPLLILDEGIADHSYYIKNILSVALEYANEVYGDNCILQQNGANSH